MVEQKNTDEEDLHRKAATNTKEAGRSPTQDSVKQDRLGTGSDWANAAATTGLGSGHIQRRFNVTRGNEFELADGPAVITVEASNGKRRPENETDYQGKPLTASETGESEGATTVVPVTDLGFNAAPPPSVVHFLESDSLRDIMDAEKLRLHLDLKPNPGSNVEKSMQERIKLSRLSCRIDKRMGRQPYLPINEFEKLFSIEPIKALVKEMLSEGTDADLRTKIDQIVGRRRILGILIWIQKLDLFQTFVEEEILDNQLPLRPEGAEDEPGTFTRNSDKINTTLLQGWDHTAITLFYACQPIFFVPFFDIQEDRLCSYVLDDRILLPWTKYEHKASGGNGLVHQVEIHESHHNFKSVQSPTKSLYFALKEIDRHDVDIYRQELSALERTCAQIQKEKHLIKLLLTFQHGERYYFLFEWADGNLGDYWENNPEPPERTLQKTRWAAEQCRGLATALKRIHGLSTMQKVKRSQLDVPGLDDREWGRHGDIKPNNILRFSSDREDGDLLVLSDLGLTRFHSSITRSLVPHTHIEGYTWPYRPPEMDMPGQHICQKYDIWSLGCVFLEFCIWWLEGFEAIQRFEMERAEADQSFRIMEEDKYFVIVESDGRPEAKVKPIVVEWIRRLRRLAVGDGFAAPMLDLIEEEMLVVDKKKRYSASQICATILEIVNQLSQTHKLEDTLLGFDYAVEQIPQAGAIESIRGKSKASTLTASNLAIHAEGDSGSAATGRSLSFTIRTNSSNGDVADELPDELSAAAPSPIHHSKSLRQEFRIDSWKTSGFSSQTTTTDLDKSVLNAEILSKINPPSEETHISADAPGISAITESPGAQGLLIETRSLGSNRLAAQGVLEAASRIDQSSVIEVEHTSTGAIVETNSSQIAGTELEPQIQQKDWSRVPPSKGRARSL